MVLLIIASIITIILSIYFINEAFGCTEFWEDGNIVVFVKATLSICDAAEILAHELAHVAVGENEGHGEAWEKAFDDIHKEYERMGESYEIYR